jgi:hypothetical protein
MCKYKYTIVSVSCCVYTSVNSLPDLEHDYTSISAVYFIHYVFLSHYCVMDDLTVGSKHVADKMYHVNTRQVCWWS